MTERLTLASWPTPLEAAPRLSVALGLERDDLWLKRDDLVGLGGGGNKVRKLEATLAEALAQGATAVVTSGAAQSNHARLTAAAGARLGLAVTLVLAGDPPVASTGNLLLDELLGARLVWAGPTSLADLDSVVEREAQRLREAGTATYVVPYGGSNVAGAGAYAEAGHEILRQAPDTALVVTAVGSGGTMAGLVHALGVGRVLGVDTGAVPDPDDRVGRLLAGLGTPVAPGELRLRRDLVGEGYGVLSAPGPRGDGAGRPDRGSRPRPRLHRTRRCGAPRGGQRGLGPPRPADRPAAQRGAARPVRPCRHGSAVTATRQPDVLAAGRGHVMPGPWP